MIHAKVEAELNSGLLWPETLIHSTLRSSRAGRSMSWSTRGFCTPVAERSSASSRTFTARGSRFVSTATRRRPYGLPREASNYVLTTGTGSGKSLAYIVPIVDHVLRRGSGKGVQAIVVYPMNALANSQYGELEKFLCHGFPDGRGPVRFACYTGQESDAVKREIVANPPDILLTNYVMLELILTRLAGT